jgi:hypothetical protein
MIRPDPTCRQVASLLDELVDQTLDDARARVVRAHLRGCAACARRAEATRALVSAAADLGRRDPPPDLWLAVSARLDEEDARTARRTRLWWWWHAWRRTLVAGGGAVAAAAAAIVLLVASQARHPLAGVMRNLPRPPVSASDLYDEAVREVARAEEGYVQAIEELRVVASDERRRWSPEAARVFDENLAAIDAAIARQAEAFRGAPDDPAAADALHATYRKKIDFLQESIVRGQLP